MGQLRIVKSEPLSVVKSEPEQRPTADDPADSGAASALVMAGRHTPAAARAGTRATGRFIAEHPATVQRAVGATVRGVAGGLGAAGGGVTGAIVGSAAGAGLTPKQESIRYLGGRMAGESKEVAREAGKAQGIQNYVKTTSGVKVKPSDILARSRGLPAAESYAREMGRDILKIYGPTGEVVAGPTAVADATPNKPSVLSRAASASPVDLATVLKLLSWLQAAVGVTDLAQTIEPDRRDIGVMGIGRTQPTPSAEDTAAINARNIAAMEARLRR